MDPGLWAEIRRLYFIEKLSKSEMARLKVIDRGTVKRAIESSSPPRYSRPVKQESKLDMHKGRIAELFSEYPSISVVRILEEIKKGDYHGGRSILSDYLRKVRGPKREKFLRIETLPGEQAQCDWGNFGYVSFGEYKRPLSCFVMTLSYSRLIYLEFTVSAAAHLNYPSYALLKGTFRSQKISQQVLPRAVSFCLNLTPPA